MLTEVALVVGLVLLAAGIWRRGARFGWATALLGVLIVGAALALSAGTRAEVRRGLRDGFRTTAASAARAAHPDAPASLTAADLAHLRWIEGTWRGAGSGQAPFYERYRFADDSTLLVESFADSTLGTVTDATRFELRGGRVTSVPGTTQSGATPAARWVASGFTPDRSITFAPLEHARNSFTWRRDAPDAWTALLDWPATPTQPARQRVYEMRRSK
jgi:hypothetical protein